MNIFILDNDIDRCAQAHVQKHIGKMQIELSQLLCAALYLNEELRAEVNPISIPYKLTHKNHPSAIWVRQDLNNYTYTAGLLFALSTEYLIRNGGKAHMSFVKMRHADITNYQYYWRAKQLDIEELRPPCCMPDEYIRSDSVVENYRSYYRMGKSHLHNWGSRPTPEWINS
jgi:hypothetical protein